MYCANCGKQIENGKAFCPYCGATQAQLNAQPVSPVQSLDQVQPAAAVAVTPTVKKSKKPLAVILSAVAVCLVAVVVCVFAFGGKSSGCETREDLIDRYMNAVELADGKQLVSLYHPNAWKDRCERLNESNSEGIQRKTENMQERADERSAEYGEYSLEYEVTDVSDITDEYLEILEGHASDYGFEMEECKGIVMNVYIVVDGERVGGHQDMFEVIRVDGVWYLWC